MDRRSRFSRTAGSARPGVHRPLARRRRDGQAHGAAGPKPRSTRTSRSSASSIRRARSRRTDDARVHGAAARARTSSTCSTCGRGKSRSGSTSRWSRSPARAGRPTERSSCSAEDRAASRISIVVNVDGTGFRRLTDDKFGDFQPQWSPDGRTIAFATDRDSAKLSRCSSSSRGASRCSISSRRRSAFFRGRRG